MAAARVAATTVNAEARCGQGASVVARVQVWWPRRAECGGDREALASTNPMLAVSSVHAVVSQGASGSERR